jgi:hypothetical protein
MINLRALSSLLLLGVAAFALPTDISQTMFGDAPYAVDVPMSTHGFQLFLRKFELDYPNAVEYYQRLANYMAHAEEINAQNRLFRAGNSSWFARLNELHTLSKDEMYTMLTGYQPNDQFDFTEGQPLLGDNVTDAPNSVDWTGRLSGVQKQTCGDCWAFSAAAAMEFKCGSGKASEMEIRDCSGAGTCKGGNPFQAIQNSGRKGIESRSQYPVPPSSASDQPCKAQGGSCHDGGVTTGSGASRLKSMLNQGVVSVTVAAGGGFIHYGGGVYTGTCGSSVNHAIAAVGYDGSNWKVRNSWGTSWGERGYMRTPIGKNVCQVEGQFGMPR